MRIPRPGPPVVGIGGGVAVGPDDVGVPVGANVGVIVGITVGVGVVEITIYVLNPISQSSSGVW